MRMMMRLSMPVDTGNRGVKDGSLERTIGGLLERLRPEASYFFPENGRRTCLVVFDLKNPADIPSVVEPLFVELNAAVDLIPVMNADDLKKGLSSLGEHAAARR
jgi:hypothetical protein